MKYIRHELPASALGTKRTCCVAISSAVNMGRTNPISRRAAQSCEFNGASFADIYCL